jgi:hypothetical protein
VPSASDSSARFDLEHRPGYGPPHRAPDPIVPWAGAFGGLLLVGSGLSALGYGLAFATALIGGASPEFVVVPGSLAVLLGLLGSGLVLGALGLQRGRPSRRFAPASAAPWLTATLLVIGLGTSVLLLGQPVLTSLLLPPLHAAATILPALALLAFVNGAAGSPGWATWRGSLARLSWGACIATFLGLLGETLIMIPVGIVVYLLLRSSASGQAAIDALLQMATSAEGAGAEGMALDPAALGPAMHPVIILAAFSILAFLAPLIEEMAKLAGVMVRPPKSRSQAWIWGCTVGAGFGLLEGVFYAALQVTPFAWPMGIAARGLTTILHATMTGLAALGYFSLRRGERRGLWAILAAVVGHGLWNGLALATVLFGLRAGASRDEAASAGGAPAMLSLLALIILFYTIFFGFLILSRRLGAQEKDRGRVSSVVSERSTQAVSPPETGL